MPWILLMHLLRPPSLYFSNVNFQSPVVFTGLGLYNNLPGLPPSPSPTSFTSSVHAHLTALSHLRKYSLHLIPATSRIKRFDSYTKAQESGI